MNTGPKVEAGFDLALTELINGEDHQFLVEVGSAIGSAVLAELPRGSASPEQLDAADGRRQSHGGPDGAPSGYQRA